MSGQETNTKLNEPESGHGLPTKKADGTVIKNNGQPLGYTPVMTDATKATTFDDIGSELNIFDTATNRFVFRYVDAGRDQSQLVTPGQFVDLGDHTAAQKIIKGSGPEQIFVRGDKLFVTYDPEDGSRLALEVAYALARARVVMKRGPGSMRKARTASL